MTTLDELRRANLQEQRRAMARQSQAKPATGDTEKAQELETPSPTTPEKKGAVKAEVVVPAENQSKAPMLTLDVVEMQAEPIVGNDDASDASEPQAVISTPVIHDAVMEDEMAVKGKAVVEAFYKRINRKTIHPTGVKATIDMPPDLFWRVKRYCHDNNNITVRQFFLDLAVSMLEEEGY